MNLYFVVRADGSVFSSHLDEARALEVAGECANVDGAAATVYTLPGLIADQVVEPSPVG